MWPLRLRLLLGFLLLLLLQCDRGLALPCTTTTTFAACVFAPACEETALGSLTFEQARARCAAHGGRLCYRAELTPSAVAAAGNPCAPNTPPLSKQTTWTLDMCVASANIGPRQRLRAALGGAPASSPKATCANADASLGTQLRCCYQPPPAYQGGRRNILWIIVDDLRPDLNVAYGRAKSTTPYLDAFALDPRTVVLERAYADYPKCSPSRMSFLTGLSPLTTGLDEVAWLRRKDPANYRILPEFFRDNGYATYTGGKVFHDGQNDKNNNPDVNGFWNGTYAANQNQGDFGLHQCPPTKKPTVFAPFLVPATGKKPTYAKANRNMCHTAIGAGEDADLIDLQLTTKALDMMMKLVGLNAPFFLAVGLYKPHEPWKVHRKYVWQTSSTLPYDTPSWMALDPGLGIVDYFDDLQGLTREVFMRGAKAKPWNTMPTWSPEKHAVLQTMHRAYRACVTETDELIGRLLERLDALKLANNTLVLVMGDNGFMQGELGLFGKYKLSEVTARVPFMVRVPGAVTTPGSVLRARKQIQLLDVYRTLAGLVGLGGKVAANVQGVDHSAYLLDRLASGRNDTNNDDDMSFSMVRRCNIPNPKASSVQKNCDGLYTTMRWLGLSVRTPHWRYNVWLDAPGENIAWPASRAQLSTFQELYDHRNDANNLVNYDAGDGASFHDVELVNVFDEATFGSLCDGLFNAIKSHFQTTSAAAVVG